MLTIIVEGSEIFDEKTEEFGHEDSIVLNLEHSLVSLSKWESKFAKPFLDKSEKSKSEYLNYIWFMVLTPNVNVTVLRRLSQDNITEINEYINSSQSATTFNELPAQRGRQEVVTAELIYYWMVAYKIPHEYETWHLNRLFALIRICNLKNSNPKKRSRSEMAQSRNQLNQQRRAELGSTG